VGHRRKLTLPFDHLMKKYEETWSAEGKGSKDGNWQGPLTAKPWFAKPCGAIGIGTLYCEAL